MSDRAVRTARSSRPLVAVGCVALALVLGSAILGMPPDGTGLSTLVEERIDEIGVESRVTAVLLGFRGYDTLLEVMVLLVAALGVRCVSAPVPPHPAYLRGPAMRGLLRIIGPMGVVLAGYMVWRGTHGTGGAFQAGAILGGTGIALALGGRGVLRGPAPRGWAALLVLGPAVFLLTGVAGLFATGTLLEIPAGLAPAAFTVIEATAVVSIGMALVTLLGEARERRGSGPDEGTRTAGSREEEA